MVRKAPRSSPATPCPDGARPIAQAYAGHQFGHFTALGDGRAILLGEQITPSGERVGHPAEGAGADAVLRAAATGAPRSGPMLREYIISEAMHALGIPTTRSLAVVTTGEPVYRETRLDGAVLTRVAASHIRVGTMQWAAAHQDRDALRALADYTLARHYPELVGAPEPLPRAVRRDRRTAGAPDRPLAARRLHPRRDEHRQHGAVGRDDRLRPVRVHGRLRSRDRVQLDRSRRPLRLRQPAADRAVEPRAAGGSDAAAVRRRRRSRRRARHGGARPLPGPVRAALAATACARSSDCSRRGSGDKALADDLLGWMQRPVGRLHEHVPVADRRAPGRGRRDAGSGIRGVASPAGGAPRRVSRSRPPKPRT